MNAHFELLAAAFVDMRAFYNRKRTFAGRQRDRTGYFGAGSKSRVDNLFCRLAFKRILIRCFTSVALAGVALIIIPF